MTAEGKARLLRRCVFGVDVDPAAVEVTQLSLYLRSLETDAPELLRTQMRFGAALLPSLEANIRCGNSLVGTDFYAQQQLELDAEQEHRLRPFDWRSREHGFGEVFAEGGFSAVIGNPPYFNVEATYGAPITRCRGICAGRCPTCGPTRPTSSTSSCAAGSSSRRHGWASSCPERSSRPTRLGRSAAG